MSVDRPVLAVNAGSTGLKVSLVTAGGRSTSCPDLERALAGPRPAAVVHRVVHGGARTGPELVDDAVLRQLHALTELAPLQQPPALAALERCRAALPDVPHVACFDTAFHHSIPPCASTYALPERLRRLVRVHGFHGLSHAWSARQAARVVPDGRRVLVAHLGGGASLCAVLDGRSIETTMGFTPLDGLVMGTRCGHLDPGAVLWLVEHTDEDLPQVLEQQSGLLGLAGSDDLRVLHRRRAAGDGAATLAVEVYLHRLTTQAGAMVAALRGLDVLVLTGGVGEHDRTVLTELARRLAWLGVAVDPTRLDGPDGDGAPGVDDRDGVVEVTAPGARVRTLVVRAREDVQMVEEARLLLGVVASGT